MNQTRRERQWPLQLQISALQRIASVRSSDKSVSLRPVYDSIAERRPAPPYLTADAILADLAMLIERRILAADPLKGSTDFSPYWQPRLRATPTQILAGLTELFDNHNAPIPPALLPPELHVSRFIDDVISLEQRSTPAMQLDVALRVTDGHLLGATHVCWIGTRLMSRGADSRAYPHIDVSPQRLLLWSDRVANFETKEGYDKNDGPGDTFYFWSQVWGHLVLEGCGVLSEIAQAALRRGEAAMKYARKYLAGAPIVADHQTAAFIGREMGYWFVALNAGLVADSDRSTISVTSKLSESGVLPIVAI
jgi:hypothetical protein